MSLNPELRDRITSLVGSDRVLLFMKGNRQAPQCGFSASVVQILDRLLPEYATFDVLSDPEIRASIKDFSQWPTIPQLYIEGEFFGGCDIVKEMYESGELHQALGLPTTPSTAPEITVTDEAAGVLRHALQGHEDQDVHLTIDAQFRNSLALGPRQDDEVVVESNGITLLLDRDSVARADGATLQVLRTERGPELSLINPNVPVAEPAPDSRG